MSYLGQIQKRSDEYNSLVRSATASFWRPKLKAVEASRPASGGQRTAKATKWCQASSLQFIVSSSSLGPLSRHIFSRHTSCSHLTSFFQVRFLFTPKLCFNLTNFSGEIFLLEKYTCLSWAVITLKSFDFLLSLDEFFPVLDLLVTVSRKNR